MKRALLILMVLSIASLSGTALAGPPLPGVYSSTDIGGTIPPGRYTEGWPAGTGFHPPGTTLFCQSWDGVSLGTVWSYSCALDDGNHVLIQDNVDVNGNGNRTWKATFIGGHFTLSGTGPWGNGDASYPGTWTFYYEYETFIYSNWVAVAAVTNVQAGGSFDNYPTACMTYTISNGSRVGTTDLAQIKPPDYPGLYEYTTCTPTNPYGAWWNMNALTMTVTADCSVPSKPTTWGALKTLYR
jgi:hypothetical protein